MSGRPDVDLPVICIDAPRAAGAAVQHAQTGVDPDVQLNRIVEGLVVQILLRDRVPEDRPEFRFLRYRMVSPEERPASDDTPNVVCRE